MLGLHLGMEEGVEGVASYSHCIQDDTHVMWSMLTGNEVACCCLHMHPAVDVCMLFQRNVVSYRSTFLIDHKALT